MVCFSPNCILSKEPTTNAIITINFVIARGTAKDKLGLSFRGPAGQKVQCVVHPGLRVINVKLI